MEGLINDNTWTWTIIKAHSAESVNVLPNCVGPNLTKCLDKEKDSLIHLNIDWHSLSVYAGLWAQILYKCFRHSNIKGKRIFKSITLILC